MLTNLRSLVSTVNLLLNISKLSVHVLVYNFHCFYASYSQEHFPLACNRTVYHYSIATVFQRAEHIGRSPLPSWILRELHYCQETEILCLGPWICVKTAAVGVQLGSAWVHQTGRILCWSVRNKRQWSSGHCMVRCALLLLRTR